MVANGADSVVLAINPTSSANPLTVAAKVRPLYDSIKIICRMLLNLTSYMTVQLRINNSINEVIKTIVEATLIVLVVITMFIGSFQCDFNPWLSPIPISLIRG